jgi:hypothetical protein
MLPELTVTAMSITSERTVAQEGLAFHLRIHVHTKQHGADLSSLVLPDVVNLTILGDEKHTSQAAGDGTDYVEILTVAGIAPGEATVSPAYINARDPSRGGGPFRFSSNSLRLRISPASQAEYFSWQRETMRLARVVLPIAVGFIVVAGIGFAIVRGIIVAARRPQTYVTLPRARAVVVPQASPRDLASAVRDATRRLSQERTRERASELRAALFKVAGAERDETLASLLARIPEDQGVLRGALRKAERATFVDEAHLQGAIEELLDALVTMGSA